MFNLFDRSKDTKVLALELRILDLERELRSVTLNKSPNIVSSEPFTRFKESNTEIRIRGKLQAYGGEKLYPNDCPNSSTWKKCEGFRPTRPNTFVNVHNLDNTRKIAKAHEIDWRIVSYWRYPIKFYA